MKINQHLIELARDSISGIFLTDDCSGAFLFMSYERRSWLSSFR